MTKEQKEVYYSDDMYLPIHYKGHEVKQPFFKGRGQLNVKQLEDLCEQFMEYTHQQAVIKQNLKDIVVSQKFNIPLAELRQE